MKKVLSLFLVFVLCLSVLVGCNENVSVKDKEIEENELLNIVTSNFAAYDFIRAVGGDKVNITFLMPPGVDSHSYEPSPADIIKIQNSDLFVYVGGEMEPWADSVIETSDNLRTLSLSDYVTLQLEAEIEGVEGHSHDDEEDVHEDEDIHLEDEDEHLEEEHSEYDYHIWTSLKNAKGIVTLLSTVLSNMDEQNNSTYISNAMNYSEEIQKVEIEIQSVVENSTLKTLVFGDKMPMQYFMNEFGLKPVAAFNGCSTETDPSASTIAFLIDYVKDHNIPGVLYGEMNNGSVAKAIADECGVKAMRIQSIHNVSKSDFEAGYTYVDLMKQNLEVLKEALQ